MLSCLHASGGYSILSLILTASDSYILPVKYSPGITAEGVIMAKLGLLELIGAITGEI